jgi:hypothetical protein
MANGAASVASIGLPAWAEASCTPTRKSRLGTACCFKPQPPPDRPDPATYSQDEQFSLGTAPTWDSPDILTNYWNPFTLMPEATVTVRNLSGLVSAVNVQVLVATSAFGIGLPRTPMSAQIISLAPGQQSQLLFPFPQSLLQAADQRIGLHVRLIHPTDARLLNNEGSQAIADAYTSKAGRQIALSFPVLNPSAAAQQISLSVLPNSLAGSVSPGAPMLAPFEQIMATLAVDVPSSLHGTAAAPVRANATVVGRDGSGKVLDGLTLVIWVDD